MKKVIGKDMGVKHTKWSAIWAVLLIFSFFTLSGIVSGHGIDNTGSAGVILEPQNETIKDKGIQTNIVENEKNKQRSSDGTEEQVKIIANSETETVVNKDTGNQKNIENKQGNKQGSSDGTEEQVKTKEDFDKPLISTDCLYSLYKQSAKKCGLSKFSKDNSEMETVVNKDTGNQIKIEKNQKNKKGSCDGTEEQVKIKEDFNKPLISTNCLYSLYEQPAKKCVLSKFSKDNSKMETVINKGTSDKLETTTVEYYNITTPGDDITTLGDDLTTPGNEELKTVINSGLINWEKMKIILAQHSGSISSFYTTSDKVEFQYKSPKTQKMYRKVNIYFVAERNQSFPEKTVMDIMDKNNISFKDVINEHTKSYVQIPVTLNEDGAMLEPFVFGPLPAGSYWILITPTENEITSSGSDKKILSANYFKVLKYEIDVKTPNKIKAGDNFDVNLTLKNSSAQENCTYYWVALIKENPQGANATANSNTKSKEFGNFMKGLYFIQNFSLNSTNCDSILSKKELQNEINTLIGVSNGTINIGEENQSNLSLSSLGLLPGNYHLIAGACEKGNGLVGVAQKELAIVSFDTRIQTKSPSFN